MRNTKERSTRPSRPSQSNSSRPTSVPSNAFSPSFLLQASQARRASPTPPPPASPAARCGPAPGTWSRSKPATAWSGRWSGRARPWPRAAGRSSSPATGRDALLAAATLPALAVPNHLHLGDKAKRLGFPLHDGPLCIGHLSRPEARIAAHLHIARTLVGHPASFALAVEALGAEEIPILGRALMRRIQERGTA